MKVRGLIAACLMGTILLAAPAARAEEELKNDGFTDDASVAFQSGFSAGEIGASRFEAPASGTSLLKVQLLFGGGVDGMQRDVILHVWDDSALEDAPGKELYSSKYSLTASDTALQELAIAGSTVTVEGPFRVGIEFTAAGLPSIARDSDGDISLDDNFILASGVGWKRSADLGVNGDWIIRAFIEGGGGSGGAGGAGGAGGTGGAGGSSTTGGTSGTGGSVVTAGSGGTGGAGGGATEPKSNTSGCSCRAAGSETEEGGALLCGLVAASVLAARRGRRAARK